MLLHLLNISFYLFPFFSFRLVVQDSLGEWHIFEVSPSGYICSPYRARIHESHSDSIVLIPVESAAYVHESVRYRESIFREVEKVVSTENQPYEPLEIMKGCVSKYLNENEENKSASAGAASGGDSETKWNYPYSPSVQIIVDILQNSTGVSIEHEDKIPIRKVTPEDIFRRRLRISTSTTTEGAVAPSMEEGGETKFGATTIIRDM
jgi:hypothetical protein